MIGKVWEGEGRRNGAFKRHQWTRDDWSEMNGRDGRDGEICFVVMALQPLRKGLSHVPGSTSLPPSTVKRDDVHSWPLLDWPTTAFFLEGGGCDLRHTLASSYYEFVAEPANALTGVLVQGPPRVLLSTLTV